MTHTTIVGLDLAKNVFQVHGIDADGRKTFSKKLRREEVKRFFENLPVDYRTNLTHFFISDGSVHTARKRFRSTP